MTERPERQKTDTYVKLQEAKRIFREVLLRDFSPEGSRSDLNIQRVNDYVKQMGIDPTPMLVFNPERREQLMGSLRRAGLYIPESETFAHELLGIYLPEINLILIQRNKELEDLNGVVLTEGSMVHEQMHADERFSEKAPDIAIKKKGEFLGFIKGRSGFKTESRRVSYGSFLEEGYAEMYRAIYIEEYAPDSFWQDLALAAGALRKDKLDPEDHFILINSQGQNLRVPASYFYVIKKGQGALKVSYDPGSLAAVGIEMLTEDEEIQESLINARYTTEGLRTLIQKLNNKYNGLYTKLRVFQNNHSDFWKGALLVQESLQNSLNQSLRNLSNSSGYG